MLQIDSLNADIVELPLFGELSQFLQGVLVTINCIDGKSQTCKMQCVSSSSGSDIQYRSFLEKSYGIE